MVRYGFVAPVMVYTLDDALSTQPKEILPVRLFCTNVMALAVDDMVFVVAEVPQEAVYMLFAVEQLAYRLAAANADRSPA